MSSLNYTPLRFLSDISGFGECLKLGDLLCHRCEFLGDDPICL